MSEHERSLPANLDAERSVLGGIIIDNAQFHSCAALVTAKSFFRDAHRRIYTAIWHLADRNEEIDLVTLKEQLERAGDLDECGGPAYIASLVDGVPRASNVREYAEIVKDKFTLRQLIHTGTKVIARGYEADTSAREIVLWSEQQMFDLAHGHLQGQMEDLKAGTRALMHDLEFRVLNRGRVTGVDTGFESINQLTLGWQPGDLVFIGARPSIGKTSFVMNSMTHAAKLGRRVAIFSMEMARKQLEFRILSSLSGVPLQRMLNGALGGGDGPAGDYVKIAAAMEVMSELPIKIDDTPARTVWDIRSSCRQLKAETDGLDAVVIDYVQLMRGTLEGRNRSRNEELTDISNRLKALARELQVPVIVLSQLARRSGDRPDPRPKMSDLKDCGAFEQDADVVVLLHRKNHREGGTTNCIFEKQRNGPTGTLNITLDRDVVTFTDGGEDPKPEPAPPPQEPRRRPLRY